MRRSLRLAMMGLVPALAAGQGGGVEAQAGGAWVSETPGQRTGCAFETPYRFFHAGLDEASDLLVYFQGGGACWEWVSCSGLFDTDVSRSELSEYRGIFDRRNAANPFRDWAIVVLPYCTGDVHVGDVEARYGDDPSARPVSHRGFRNAMAVLDWVERRVGRPDRVVVSGASAGAYAALFYTPEIVRRFPGSRITLLGDSGLPLLQGYENVLRGWGSDSVLARIRGQDVAEDPELLSLAKAHEEASAEGAVRVAQISSDHDAIQSAFYLISGSPDWRNASYALLDDIAARVPHFRSYLVAGSDHGLLRTDRFYEYEADGVRLREWVADLVDGRAVPNVRCVTCVR